MSTTEDYTALVAARKACHRCQGLTNPAAVKDGSLDSEHIGPWSIWQGNLNARVMVVGQDWGDKRYFLRNKGRDTAHNFTNRALVQLLAEAGVKVEPLDSAHPSSVAFFTNAVLCLKSDGLQGSVRSVWFKNCHDYLRRQIEIVRPKVVVGLGERAYRAILQSFDLLVGPFRDEVEAADGRLLPTGSRVFAVYHCGARIRNTHRPLEAQKRDWRRLRPHVVGAG